MRSRRRAFAPALTPPLSASTARAGRVPKTLAQRTHHCPHCGLRADRDVTAAMLAACIDVADPDDPRTARVDFDLAHALRARLASQQERGAQSTGTSHQHHLLTDPGAVQMDAPAHFGEHPHRVR
jgi:hypothetical protein